ncbi:Alpha/Beta hydrolase protein [Aspergillus unguis]
MVTFGDIEVVHKPISSLSLPDANYNGLVQETTVIPAGFRKSPEHRAFPCNTIWERDTEIPLRDGTVLRGDVFRPEGTTEKVPIILVWTPYGKTGTGNFSLDMIQSRDGIPKDWLSGFECWESPDPAEWVPHGYAIANVDARGIFKSGGNHRWHGTPEGQDGYDTIEFLGQLPWSNGRVTLMGNSWLGTAQWYIAAERPPHLACIVPLEGLSDVYRETLCRGGVPYKPFWAFLRDHGLYGENEQEDPVAMIDKYPLMNDYWEDKRAKADRIEVPAYILASMSSALHTIGSTRCFEDIPHQRKWLRLSPTQEWHDLYQKENIADVRRFCDFFMKDIQNGWEETPRARISVLRFNQSPLVNLPFANWPPPESKYRSYYLSHGAELASGPVSTTGKVSYKSDVPGMQMDEDDEAVTFSMTFTEKTTIMGASRAILYMSCAEHDDMDVFVQLRKRDKNGKILRNLNIPLADMKLSSEEEVETINSLKYLGPSGILRASHRALDPRLSKPHWPAHDRSRREVVPPGTIGRLEIGLWPAAIQFEAGEALVLKVAGHHMTLAEFTPLRGLFTNSNKGQHEVHFGGEYASRLDIPFVEI